MKIRLLSDLHLEFSQIDLPVMENEHEQVLVLAGDIGIAKKYSTYTSFLKEMSERFGLVVYILGNHEHYDGSVKRSAGKICSNIKHEGLLNVEVAHNRTVKFGDTSFICSTLWSSFKEGDPMVMYDVEYQMNDYRLIRTGTDEAPYLRKFKPMDAYEEFLESVNFIFPEIEKEKAKGQKTVVVTHMAPSWNSIHEKYKTGPFSNLNGAYASRLEEDIFQTKPDLMVHGHVHDSFDYYVGETRIVCNLRGYFPDEVNPYFNPELVLEV